ncbi:MAG TPA: type 1 glutamine amidotransferase [Cellulomonas sp.]
MSVESTPGAPVLTVVQLDEVVPLDRFAGWLEGVDVRLVRAWAGEQAAPAATLGGLLVLGGRMSAHAEAEPGITATRALLADAVAADLPTLGLCLGAQLLAVATGGRVHVDAPPGREAGIVDVRWRPEATGDPLVGALAAAGRSTPMPTMHADAIVDLPRGATWLAASRMYPYQAFRTGSAWGLQFHPEASPALMHAWAVDAAEGARPDETAATGQDGAVDRSRAEVAAIDDAVAAHDAAVAHAGQTLARTFATLVVARAAR